MEIVNLKVLAMLSLYITIYTQISCYNETEVTICAANNRSKCKKIDQLSDILTELQNETEVSVQLISGIHYLHNTLNFSTNVKQTEFYGANYSEPSIIQCKNGSGIYFSENQRSVKISNINFTNCGRERATFFSVAIYLKAIDTCSLENVTVYGTKGYGYYAENCLNQNIKHCTFTSNKEGHGKITFNRKNDVSILISNTSFKTEHNGNYSGGLNLTICKNCKCSLSIINCNFTGGNGSHLLINIESKTLKTQVIVSSCIFTKAKGLFSTFSIVLQTFLIKRM